MNTFDVTYSPAITRSEPIRTLVEQATRWLEGILGQSRSVVKAHWDMYGDELGRESITLRLSDFTSPQGLVEQFRPNELGNRVHAERRFYRLFGDLLQLQNHRLLNELVSSSAAEGN
jgi:hypothetical protein